MTHEDEGPEIRQAETSGRLFDRITQLDKPATKVWTHPEWEGVVIHLKSITVGERARWASKIEIVRRGRRGKREKDVARIDTVTFEFLLLTCFDEHGHPLLTKGDKERFRDLNAGIVDDLFEAAAELSGINKDKDDDDEDQDPT